LEEHFCSLPASLLAHPVLLFGSWYSPLLRDLLQSRPQCTPHRALVWFWLLFHDCRRLGI
jgi:hypothetical protein